MRPETWRQTIRGMVEEPRGQAKALLRVPSLSIWGTQDGIFSEHDQEVLARHIPKLKAIQYPGIGHAPHWEAPDKVAVDIETFLLAQAEQHRATAVAEHKHA